MNALENYMPVSPRKSRPDTRELLTQKEAEFIQWYRTLSIEEKQYVQSLLGIDNAKRLN